MKKWILLILLAGTLVGLAGTGAVEASVVYSGRLQGASYDSTWLRCPSGSYVCFEMRGQGCSDVDIYIYDSNDNCIAADTRYSDYGIVEFHVPYDGWIRIRVVNRGHRGDRISVRRI